MCLGHLDQMTVSTQTGNFPILEGNQRGSVKGQSTILDKPAWLGSTGGDSYRRDFIFLCRLTQSESRNSFRNSTGM
jgi:hypothetical protein